MTDLEAENKRLLALCHKMKEAMVCCTIVGWSKEQSEIPGFNQGVMLAIEGVVNNLREHMNAPRKNWHMWLERQIDPEVKFVDSNGVEIPYAPETSDAIQ